MAKLKARSLMFPAGGLDKSQGYQSQPPYTTPDCNNVWPESQEDDRAIGGSRPGLQKAFDDTIASTSINMLADLTYIDSNRARKRQLVAACNGTLAYWESGDTTWTTVSTSLTLASSYLLHASSQLQKLYIADYSQNYIHVTNGTSNVGGTQLDSATIADWTNPGGTYETPNADDYVVTIRSVNGSLTHVDVGVWTINTVAAGSITLDATVTGSLTNVEFFVERSPKIYDPNLGTLTAHVTSNNPQSEDLETYGIVPIGQPLVTTWRDRLVYAGGHDLPTNWHMSKLGDPLTWITTTLTTDAAVSGQSSDLGQIAEPITALIPFQDQSLIIGSENQLWIIQGDPGDGGQINNISYEIGVLAGKAWARVSTKEVVFLSKDGLYGMTAEGSLPRKISRERIPADLLFTDDSDSTVLLEYDKLNNKILLFIV